MVLNFLSSPASKESPGAGRLNRLPKLIVMMVIGQFRYDYLVRFRPQFVEAASHLLLQQSSFVNSRYDAEVTVTCSGHTSLFTAAYPRIHGIIGNEWYDRSLYGKVSYVSDADTEIVGAQEAPANHHTTCSAP